MSRRVRDRVASSSDSGAGAVSWFASDPSKAYYERYSLVWAPLSMAVLLILILGTPIYKHCDRNSYLVLTILGCLPSLYPIVFPPKHDLSRPFAQRFPIKAMVWLSIFGFYGNYFWTHYFYHLLGAQYLFDSYTFNDVPLVTYTCTFFYFSAYFTLTNLILRRVSHFLKPFSPVLQHLLWVFAICLLAYGTALFEALSIQHFPLYTYTHRETFLLIGSVVYGLYFIIGFPMFFQIDETPTRRSSLVQVAINALAAVAIVTLLLDLWRLCLGSIYDVQASIRIPFLYQSTRQVARAPSRDCAQFAQQCAQWLQNGTEIKQEL